MQVTGLEIFK